MQSPERRIQSNLATTAFSLRKRKEPKKPEKSPETLKKEQLEKQKLKEKRQKLAEKRERERLELIKLREMRKLQNPVRFSDDIYNLDYNLEDYTKQATFLYSYLNNRNSNSNSKLFLQRNIEKTIHSLGPSPEKRSRRSRSSTKNPQNFSILSEKTFNYANFPKIDLVGNDAFNLNNQVENNNHNQNFEEDLQICFLSINLEKQIKNISSNDDFYCDVTLDSYENLNVKGHQNASNVTKDQNGKPLLVVSNKKNGKLRNRKRKIPTQKRIFSTEICKRLKLLEFGVNSLEQAPKVNIPGWRLNQMVEKYQDLDHVIHFKIYGDNHTKKSNIYQARLHYRPEILQAHVLLFSTLENSSEKAKNKADLNLTNSEINKNTNNSFDHQNSTISTISDSGVSSNFDGESETQVKHVTSSISYLNNRKQNIENIDVSFEDLQDEAFQDLQMVTPSLSLYIEKKSVVSDLGPELSKILRKAAENRLMMKKTPIKSELKNSNTKVSYQILYGNSAKNSNSNNNQQELIEDISRERHPSYNPSTAKKTTSKFTKVDFDCLTCVFCYKKFKTSISLLQHLNSCHFYLRSTLQKESPKNRIDLEGKIIKAETEKNIDSDSDKNCLKIEITPRLETKTIQGNQLISNSPISDFTCAGMMQGKRLNSRQKYVFMRKFLKERTLGLKDFSVSYSVNGDKDLNQSLISQILIGADDENWRVPLFFGLTIKNNDS